MTEEGAQAPQAGGGAAVTEAEAEVEVTEAAEADTEVTEAAEADTEVTEAAEADTEVTEAAEAEVEVTEAAEADTEAEKSKRILPDARTLVAAAVAAVLLGGVAALGWQVWQQHQINQARDEALHAAVSYAEVLTSIDSDHVDDNFRQVLDGATGDFKDMYSQSSGELRQLLIENKATAHGVVIDSAVQSVSKDKAVVLLFVDQSVSNTKLPDPRIDRSRMKMTLEKVDGRWRASKVELP